MVLNSFISLIRCTILSESGFTGFPGLTGLKSPQSGKNNPVQIPSSPKPHLHPILVLGQIWLWLALYH
ncbi:hypothetical protein BGP_5208 [Beggiatoa sp. PS]|nr:hypothetical protein BGP_5208 [Beggiatoa sp. PS]